MCSGHPHNEEAEIFLVRRCKSSSTCAFELVPDMSALRLVSDLAIAFILYISRAIMVI